MWAAEPFNALRRKRDEIIIPPAYSNAPRSIGPLSKIKYAKPAMRIGTGRRILAVRNPRITQIIDKIRTSGAPQSSDMCIHVVRTGFPEVASMIKRQVREEKLCSVELASAPAKSSAEAKKLRKTITARSRIFEQKQSKKRRKDCVTQTW